MDWTKSMNQTFEFVSVNPNTWMDEKIIDSIRSASIEIDSDTDTLYSANITSSKSLGEQYIRIYFVAVQNGETYRRPLGTFLVQTPSFSFNGKVHNVSIDAYSPLLELKEKKPPIGFTVLKNENIIERAISLCSENMRAPVISTFNEKQLTEHFISDPSETWFLYLSALISNANYKFFIDELGQVSFEPIKDVASLNPKYTYADNEVSILQPDISVDKDLYGIPNTVEVVYSLPSGGVMYSKIVNDNPSSIVSTVNRGRTILYRDTSPSLPGIPSQSQLDEYAKNLLKRLSTIEGTITYKHGFCPVRVGDCVYINYERAGITDLKAVVKRQTIECKTGCQVSEEAVFTENLLE